MGELLRYEGLMRENRYRTLARLLIEREVPPVYFFNEIRGGRNMPTRSAYLGNAVNGMRTQHESNDPLDMSGWASSYRNTIGAGRRWRQEQDAAAATAAAEPQAPTEAPAQAPAAPSIEQYADQMKKMYARLVQAGWMTQDQADQHVSAAIEKIRNGMPPPKIDQSIVAPGGDASSVHQADLRPDALPPELAAQFGTQTGFVGGGSGQFGSQSGFVGGPEGVPPELAAQYANQNGLVGYGTHFPEPDLTGGDGDGGRSNPFSAQKKQKPLSRQELLQKMGMDDDDYYGGGGEGSASVIPPPPRDPSTFFKIDDPSAGLSDGGYGPDPNQHASDVNIDFRHSKGVDMTSPQVAQVLQHMGAAEMAAFKKMHPSQQKRFLGMMSQRLGGSKDDPNSGYAAADAPIAPEDREEVDKIANALQSRRQQAGQGRLDDKEAWAQAAGRLNRHKLRKKMMHKRQGRGGPVLQGDDFDDTMPYQDHRKRLGNILSEWCHLAGIKEEKRKRR